MTKDFPHGDITYAILGACFEVYNQKGCGFLEPVYQECLELEFRLRDLEYEAQTQIPLEYKGTPLKHKYTPDFICMGKVVVEIKAVSVITEEHRAQVINYLKATDCDVALLVNFGHYPSLEYERILNVRRDMTTPQKDTSSSDRNHLCVSALSDGTP